MRAILSLVFFLLMVSCSNSLKKEDLNTDNDTGLTLIKSTIIKKLPLPDTVTIISNAYHLIEFKNGKRLFSKSNENSGLLIYDFDTEKLVSSFSLPQEGENAVGKLAGYSVIDSVHFLFTISYKQKLYLTDLRGNILKKIDYSKLAINEDATYSVIGRPIIQKDSLLYMPMMPTGYTGGLTKQDLYNYPILMVYNLKHDSLKSNRDIRFPKSLIENDQVNNATKQFYYWVTNDSLLVYSFCFDHNLYSTNGKTELKQHQLKSKYFSQMKTPEDIREFLKYGHYLNFMWDKYRKVYYRFAYIGADITANENPDQINQFKKQFSIMIISEDFKLLGEVLMPENTYFMEIAFVAKEGLYISTNHINNPNLDENFLTFDCFELVKK